MSFARQLDRLRRSRDPQDTDVLSIAGQLRLLSEEETPARARPGPISVLPLPDGDEVTTPRGRHYRMHRRFQPDYCHGRVRLDAFTPDGVARLIELSRSRLEPPSALGRIAFLDTETTGISGGTGMCPFLIGIGYFSANGFEVEQYLIRDFDEEPSMLEALAGRLTDFELLVTYNGQSFDAPLVETRATLSRIGSPFARLGHLDLLFMARRLWREGHGSCRLVALEREILGFDRGPDIPGSLIPQAYFNFLRSSDAVGLRSVISHHVHDIVSLAALTVEAARVVRAPPSVFDCSRDQYSLARVFDAARETAPSRLFYERALEGSLPPELEARAMERLAVLYRRSGDQARSLEMCERLMARGDFSAVGYEGAAMLHEHHLGDLEAASSVTRDALDRLGPRSGRGGHEDRFHSRLERIERKRQRVLFRDHPDRG